MTAHSCAITVTKTPSQKDVCSSANTLITYTYVVTNTGDVDLTNVKVSDDTLSGAQAAFEAANGNSTTLKPGAANAVTFTLKATITTTTTNKVSVQGDAFGLSPAATNSATATVTAHSCAITVTKTPSPSTICAGTSTTITYTITVKNTGDVDLTNVTVKDDVLGDLTSLFVAANGNSSTLAAGASVTIKPTKVETATTVNTVAVQGDAFGLSPAATASAKATVTANPCASSQLAPTTTTCAQFRDGTAGTENVISYGVKSGLINNVAPGVLFYYTKFQVSTSGTVVVDLKQTMGDSLPFFGVQSAQIFTGSCGTVSGASINTATAGHVFITLTNVSAGDTFIANIKIDPGTIVGSPAPSPTTVNFSYATVIGGNTLTSASGTIVRTH